MIKKKLFFKCIFNHAEQRLPRWTSLKNQVKVPKKRWSQKITEKRQNDDYKWRHTSKAEHDIKKNFKLFLWSSLTTFTMINIVKKSSYSTWNRDLVKNYWKTAKWRQYDVIQSTGHDGKNNFFPKYIYDHAEQLLSW